MQNTAKWQQHRSRVQAARQRHDALVRECRELLDLPDVSEALAAEPHPNNYLASQHKTLADYYQYRIKNASVTGLQKIARKLRGIAALAA